MNSLSNDAVLSPQARSRLGETLKSLLGQRLAPLMRALFDSLDDSLFDLAEHAREPARQRDFFDGMRECRLRRKPVEDGFLSTLQRGMDAAFRDDLRTIGIEHGAETAGDEALGLVEHEDLEEDLALQAMVAKCEGQLAQTLFALNQRVGCILEIPGLDDSDNPLGPAALAEAFRTSARRLDIPMHVRLVVFKLFERHLLGALGPVYKELSDRLAEAGILPSIKPRLREVRNHASAPARPADALEGGNADTPRGSADAVAGAAATDDSAVLARLIESIGSRRAMASLRNATPAAEPGDHSQAGSTLPGDYGALAEMAERIPTSTLQEALDQLQHRASPSPSPDKLKQLLLEQSHRLVGEESVTMRPADENVVDLVGMLFEQLQMDQRLPATMQKLLTQLHVPVLRAALFDQNILSNAEHPARRLIEEIGSAAVGWSADADPGQRLLNRVKETVDWLRHSFESDISVFEQALRDFRAFSEAQRRRAELAEQRATEAALGRERLLLARRSVAGELNDRLSGRSVARWLGQLVARPWANYLVLQWLRQGPDSAALSDGLRFVDDLVLAGERPTASQAERLRARLPELETCMRRGLATVAFHDSEIEFLAAQLRSYLATSLNETGEVAIDRTKEPVPAFFDAAIDDLEDQPGAEDVAEVSQTVTLLQSEGTGRWFELKQESGSHERAKLAWISPISTRCLLVNRQGMKVSEQRLESLASDLERGVAQMLEGGLLVQHALEGMMESLAEQSVADLRAG